MQEHTLHQEGSYLGGSPKGGEGNPSGQTPMGTPVLTQQVEADYRDETIQSFAQNILRLGNECRSLADENKRLKEEVFRLECRVNYWRVEAECDHGRWLRCLEDLEHLRRLK
jgi:predicted RNase H-like nuclease (RuvC/YqgF family)